MRSTALLLTTILAGSGCSLFASLDGLSDGADAIAPVETTGDGGPTQPSTPSDRTGAEDAAGPTGGGGSSDASAPDGPAKDADAPLPPDCKTTGFRTGLDAANLGAGEPWAEPAKALDGDGSMTESLLTSTGPESTFLRISRFELGIPADATIRGATVRVKRAASSGGIRDAEVRLAPGGQAGGTNRQTTPLAWGNETVVYGGANDLWGLSLTPSLLNGDELGIVIKARFTGTAGNARARVDSVAIDVAYCQ